MYWRRTTEPRLTLNEKPVYRLYPTPDLHNVENEMSIFKMLNSTLSDTDPLDNKPVILLWTP